MKLTNGAKRLNIFVYFDKDGIVDEYVVFLVREMRRYCTEQHLVVNGFLLPKEEEKLAPFCDKILKRENVGYDITAYKTGFLSVENPLQYDEILFFNQSIFGPLFSPDKMFEEMAGRDVDFWGLTRHKGSRASTWDNEPFPPHLQSFFFAVRRDMFCDERFCEYWQNLADIDDYWSAVGNHEVKFTERFSSLGYRWESYIDTSRYEDINDYHLMGMPELAFSMGCPFVKRKSFMENPIDYSSVVQGCAATEIYRFIKEKTDYPFRYIADNILRTVDINTITSAMSPVFDSEKTAQTKHSVAVVVYLKNDQCLDFLADKIAQYSESHDVYCLTNIDVSPRGASVIKIEGGGLDYLMNEFYDRLCDYDYLLYLNNDIPPLLREFVDASTLFTAVDCLSPQGCAEILNDNPEYGLLISPIGYHQECFSTGTNWHQVADRLEECLKEQGVLSPLSTGRHSLAVRGNLFFARTASLIKGFRFLADNTDDMFPSAEFVLPILTQSRGYLTGFACTKKHAFNQMCYKDRLIEIFSSSLNSTKHKTHHATNHRMNAILDFYYERRFQMTLQQAYNGNLKFKDKLFIVAQLFLKPDTFKKLRRGKTEPQPTDELD